MNSIVPGTCQRCPAHLVDYQGDSWPYCEACKWCPQCGLTHQVERDPRVIDVAAE